MTASASEMLNEAETVADAGTDYTLIIRQKKNTPERIEILGEK